MNKEMNSNVILGFALFIILALTVIGAVTSLNDNSTRDECIRNGYAGSIRIISGDSYCYRVEDNHLVTIAVTELEGRLPK